MVWRLAEERKRMGGPPADLPPLNETMEYLHAWPLNVAPVVELVTMQSLDRRRGGEELPIAVVIERRTDLRPRPRELALLIAKLLREEHPAYVLVPHDDDDGPDFCAELNDVTWGLSLLKIREMSAAGAVTAEEARLMAKGGDRLEEVVQPDWLKAERVLDR